MAVLGSAILISVYLWQILFCNIGNPQSLGQQPITFFREVCVLELYSSKYYTVLTLNIYFLSVLDSCTMWPSSPFGQKWDTGFVQVFLSFFLSSNGAFHWFTGKLNENELNSLELICKKNFSLENKNLGKFFQWRIQKIWSMGSTLNTSLSLKIFWAFLEEFGMENMIRLHTFFISFYNLTSLLTIFFF